MTNVYRLAGVFTTITLLAGCAAPPPDAPTQVAAASPVIASSSPTSSAGVDGVYRAPAGGVSGNSRCRTTMFGHPIRVAGGVASMASVSHGTLEGPVGPDGSLAIEKGRAMLRGQFADGHFSGTYSSGSCSYNLAYTKR